MSDNANPAGGAPAGSNNASFTDAMAAIRARHQSAYLERKKQRESEAAQSEEKKKDEESKKVTLWCLLYKCDIVLAETFLSSGCSVVELSWSR